MGDQEEKVQLIESRNLGEYIHGQMLLTCLIEEVALRGDGGYQT